MKPTFIFELGKTIEGGQNAQHRRLKSRMAVSTLSVLLIGPVTRHGWRPGTESVIARPASATARTRLPALPLPPSNWPHVEFSLNYSEINLLETISPL